MGLKSKIKLFSLTLFHDLIIIFSYKLFGQYEGRSGMIPDTICLAAIELVVLPPYGILPNVNTSYIRQPLN